jgi:hypothetical protein
MTHITEYLSREAAALTYSEHRRKWSRQASLLLTQHALARSPITRLAAALTLAIYGIPRQG